MKNIFKTLILVFGILLFNSCSDELDQQPNDSFSPDTYYQSVSDFETATRGIYEAFISGGYYGGSFISRPDITTDNVILAQSGRHSNQWVHEWRYNANDYWDMMYAPYMVTNRANLIIEYIDNIEDGDVKNNYLGEARAARAIALFDMLRVYSKIPTQSGDANASLGMPIITEIDPAIEKLRPTVTESYQFIIEELEAAKSLINVNNGSGRLNKNAVNAMLSRAYLYTGNYASAVSTANAVSASIASIASFPGVWTDSNDAGVLFKIDQDQVLDGISIGVEWSQSVGGTIVPEYVVAFDFYNLYTSDDVRKDAYTFFALDSDGNSYNAIKKMLGEAGQNNGQVDPKVIRVAEVYLNKAEAYAKMGGNDANALAALNELRSNRYASYIAGTETGAALLDAIKLERRLELFAEGHRLFDLKRWNEPVVRSAVYGEFSDGTGTTVPTAYQNLATGDYKFQFPIPQREINIFPDFQQNPGY